LDGWAVGDVIASTADGFAPGDAVLHYLGWRDIARVPVSGPAWTAPRRVDPARDPSAYLGGKGFGFVRLQQLATEHLLGARG